MARKAAHAHSLKSPSDSEVDRIRGIVKRHEFPPSVSVKFKVELGEDHGGHPSVFVVFRVDKNREPTKAYIDRLIDFDRAVSAALRAADSSRWPYIRFVTRA